MTTTDLATQGDAELIEAVRAGQTAAEGELFVRHQPAAVRYARRIAGASDAEDLASDAFMRVIEAIRSGLGPEVAFRPYLMTAVRNRHVDHVRKDSRHVWVGDEVVMDSLVDGDDLGGLREESDVIATAFHSLPERWQMVLWHSLVEKDPLSVTGQLLDMKPNAVAALTYRAKEGLRDAYLARHMLPSTGEECQPTRALMPAHYLGRLTSRQRSKVDAHLAECAACAGSYQELATLDSRLAAQLGPGVLGVAVVSSTSVAGAAGGWDASSVVVGRSGTLRRAGAVAGVAVAVLIAAMLWASADEDPFQVVAPAASASGPLPTVTPTVPDPTVPAPAPSDRVTPGRPEAVIVPVAPTESAPRATSRPTTPPVVEDRDRPRQSSPPPAPVPSAATPLPGPDLAIRSLTGQGVGAGRFVLDADVIAASASPVVTVSVKDLSSYEVGAGDGAPAPRCSAGKPIEGWTTLRCAYSAALDGRTSLTLGVTGRTLEARVRVDDAAADDPRPSNNAARVTVN